MLFCCTLCGCIANLRGRAYIDIDEGLGDGGRGRGGLLPHLEPVDLGDQRRERGQVDAAARADDAAQHPRHQDTQRDTHRQRVHQLHDAGRPTH